MNLVLSIGDPCGIGPEITAKALHNLRDFLKKNDVTCTVAATKELFQACLPTTLTMDSLNPSLVTFAAPSDFEMTFPTTQPKYTDVQTRALISLGSLNYALDKMNGESRAMVTAPLDKSIVRKILPKFSGHTEYLMEQTRSDLTVMLLANSDLACALLTHHISLKDVPLAMSENLLVKTVLTVANSLTRHFKIAHPKFALAGLNPHAGEISQDSEEERIFKPAIATLAKKGVKIDGPFPADSLYTGARKGPWDVIVSPYHDQGLVAVKYPGLHEVVNITCGLPWIRTSPGHGTAYDIAGKNIADARSIERAIITAITGKLPQQA